MIACVALSACTKHDILDIAPTDRLSESAIWNDATLPQLFINAQYNALLDGYTQEMQYFSDDCYSQYDAGGYQTIARGSLSPSNVSNLSPYYAYWGTAYAAIHNFNIFFQKIESAPVTTTAKAQMSAEVKFLRAFVYARLIWNYGGVPIIDKVYTLNDQLTGAKRNTYDECVAYILKDLDDAIAVLPSQQTGANLGRASADAARALKSRVLLYYASPLNNIAKDKKRWQDASDAALDVITTNRYALSSDFHGLFIGATNTEVIFSRYFSTDVFTQIGFTCGPNGDGGQGQKDPSQTLVDAFEMTNGVIPVIDGTINPDPKNTYDPQNPYANRDPRFYSTALYNGAIFKGAPMQPYPGGANYSGNDATNTGYYLYKFIDPSLPIAATTPYTYPYPYFRLAEIYLNYAEAQYNLGNEANARLYINKVRERSGVNMPDITETGTALFDRIKHERQIELALEGHRYYDVRRWKIAPQTESKPIQGFKIIRNTNGSFTYNRVDLLKRTWKDAFYYLPIAFADIQTSGGSLTQNPGY